MTILKDIISLIFAYIACLGFCFLFNIRGKLLFIAPIGAVISWGAYLICDGFIESPIINNFIATMACALFCEIIARVMKTPVTVFMIIAFLPLVPGSGIYYSMIACVQADYEKFFLKGIETIGIAGAIAVGMIVVSSLFKIATAISKHAKNKRISQ